MPWTGVLDRVKNEGKTEHKYSSHTLLPDCGCDVASCLNSCQHTVPAMLNRTLPRLYCFLLDILSQQGENVVCPAFI